MSKTIDKQKQFKNKVSLKNITIIFFVICALAIVPSFVYYGRLNDAIRYESKNYLKEISSRIGANVNRIINDNYSILYTLASVIESSKMDSMDEIFNTFEKQKNFWDYETLLLIEETGKAYELNGQEVFINLSNEMYSAILNGNSSMSTTQMVNHKEYILFAVPLNDPIIDGKKIKAIAASYDPTSFERTLSMNSFDEKAYSQVITKSGTVITRSTSEYAMKTGYNIFSTIETAELDDKNSLQTIKADMNKGVSNQIGFTLDGVHRYMIYTPLELEQWYLITFVPVSVINDRSNMILKITIVICSLITLIFAGLIAVLIYTFSANKRQLEKMAYIDPVTNGNTIQRFYQLSKASLENSEGIKYALVYTNIEKFKVLNEQLGRQNCDLILTHFYNHISSQLADDEHIGRLFADNFCVLVRFESGQELTDRFLKWQEDSEKISNPSKISWPTIISHFGVYVIENNSISFPQMIDRAKLALRSVSFSSDSKVHINFYDDDIRHQLLREKTLEDMMDYALANNEFQVYLQPKYKLPNEVIDGAEALVRWDSSEHGMIFPNEFIPLFEKNGFIIKLDIWVFEEICKCFRKWLDAGLPAVKVSVNSSRIHLKKSDFLLPYLKIADAYNIPHNLIEIEVTESMVLENIDRLNEIVNEIHSVGFGCSMDDFGCGYSSLNMIQSIPVDTLKLDKIFFHSTADDSTKTEAIVKSVVSMASALSMETVAEGVEVREHVEMLKRVGCNYIQGYIFAKPMKISDFEKLAFGNIIS